MAGVRKKKEREREREREREIERREEGDFTGRVCEFVVFRRLFGKRDKDEKKSLEGKQEVK